MKLVKIVILSCGVVGLLALVVPFSGRSLLDDAFRLDPLSGIVYAAIFVVPAAMAAIALARPPMQAWQPGVALAGFVLGAVRFEVWALASQLGSAGLPGALLLVAIVAGAIGSVIALLKPEAL